MAKPDPQVGSVICYDYLWKHEKRKGYGQGVKDRPCAVIVTMGGEANRVLVCPVTSEEPEEDQTAILLTAEDKAQMGVNPSKRQWVVTSEANIVDWDDEGIIPVPATGDWLYGTMTSELAAQVQADALSNLNAGKLAMVPRPVK